MSSFLYWVPKSEADPPELKSGDSPIEKIPHEEWKKEGGRLALPAPYANTSTTRLKRIFFCLPVCQYCN